MFISSCLYSHGTSQPSILRCGGLESRREFLLVVLK